MPAQEHAVCEKASQSAFYFLQGREDEAFRKHLNSCASCRGETRFLSECLDSLNDLEACIEPPPSLKQSLMSRIRSDGPQISTGHTPKPRPTLLATADLEWEKGPVPGLFFKQLHIDPVAKRMTMLVRLSPGGSFPSHEHRDFEESLLLEGDLTRDGALLKPGDYQYAPPGSSHALQQTQHGCVLWVSASLEDAYLG